MYILDTNTLIYFFKGAGNVSRNLLGESPRDMGIPAVVLFELEYGIRKSTSPRRRLAQLGEMVSLVTILPFDRDCARQAAIIRADLERKGRPIGPFDVLIAGTAMANKGTLVTHNTQEFGRIKNLTLADWY